MNNMESNKHAGLGERIIGDINNNFIDSPVAVTKMISVDLINKMDLYRQLKQDEENLTIGTIDAIDDLVQRAINKIEEASMLFTKAMYKTNK